MNHVVNEPTGLFQRCPFDSTVIILCIRWYITYKRSYRDLVAIMAERNVDVVYTTIVRWVQRYVPGFETGWQRSTHPVGASWRVDERYLTVKGKWISLYRAVDRAGQTVDFLVIEQDHRQVKQRVRPMLGVKRFAHAALTISGIE